jgi:peptidoglycan hydrolase-like protein with peptidoglycan-binding domain
MLTRPLVRPVLRIALILGLLVVIGALLPCPWFTVSENVVTSSLTFVARQDLRLDRLALPFAACRPVVLASGFSAADRRVISSIVTPRDRMELRGLWAPAGTTLSFTLTRHGPGWVLQILLSGTQAPSVDLYAEDGLEPPHRSRREACGAAAPGTPQPIHVAAADTSKVPMRLEAWLQPIPLGPTAVLTRYLDPDQELTDWADQLQIDQQQIAGLRYGRLSDFRQDLSFDERTASTFVSAIRRGIVAVPGTGTTLALAAGGPLVAAGSRGELVHLGLEQDGFHVTFHGRATSLRAGPVGADQNLSPRILTLLLGLPLVKKTVAGVSAVGVLLLGFPQWLLDLLIEAVGLEGLVVLTKKSVRLLPLAGGALAASLLAAPARAQPAGVTGGALLAWQTIDDTVRIVTTQPDGSPGDQGFGFVFGQDGSKLYVATADHVVRQHDLGQGQNQGQGHAAPSVRVIFHNDQGHPCPAELLPLEVSQARGDLAVLEIDAPPRWRGRFPTMADVDALTDGTYAWRIGKEGLWIPPINPGELVDRDTIWMQFDALDTPRGSSGGPIVTADGVVGIVVADGGLTGGFAKVLPISTISAMVHQWQLPWNLRRPGTPPDQAPAGPAAREIIVPPTQPAPYAASAAAPPLSAAPAMPAAPATPTPGDAAAAELALGLSQDDQKAIQHALNQAGLAAGDEDGLLGPQARGAIGGWQARQGLPVTGFLDADQFRRLVASSFAAPAGPPAWNPSQAALRGFVTHYYGEMSGPGALDYLRAVLADQVTFYGQTMTRDALLSQQQQALQRWPDRSFVVRPESLSVRCDPAGTSCEAAGVVDFDMRSEARNASSRGSERFTLQLAPGRLGGPAVTGVNSVVLQAQRGLAHAAATDDLSPASLPGMQDSRWTAQTQADCASRYFVWRISGDMFEFTDQNGRTDMERVVTRDPDGVVTQTVFSNRGDALDARWSFRPQGPGRVLVQNLSNGRNFTLTRCLAP